MDPSTQMEARINNLQERQCELVEENDALRKECASHGDQARRFNDTMVAGERNGYRQVIRG